MPFLDVKKPFKVGGSHVIPLPPMWIKWARDKFGEDFEIKVVGDTKLELVVITKEEADKIERRNTIVNPRQA